MHCEASQELRNGTSSKWQDLADWVADTLGIDVVEVGTRATIKCSSQKHHGLCGRLTLLQTAEVIRNASLYVGIDSGPAHLANAVGTRGVLIFGKYQCFDRYMPYSGRFADEQHCAILFADGPPS